MAALPWRSSRWRGQRGRRRRLDVAAAAARRRTFGPEPPAPASPAAPPGRPERELWYELDGIRSAVGSMPELSNVQMYVQSYNEMMSGNAWVGDWEGALGVMQDMRSLAVPPDATSYLVLLSACRRGEAGWERASEFLEEMWQKDLDPDAECYSTVISACIKAGADERAKELRAELQGWGAAPDVVRFHTTPVMKWNRQMRRYGCSVRNVLHWKGKMPVPTAPGPVWFLPNQDDEAVSVAVHQAALREAGWKVVGNNPSVVAMLGNKAEFRKHAESLGFGELLPRHYDSPQAAGYPCILKPALGTFGKDTYIVRSSEDVLRITGTERLSPKWLLQELIPGRLEYSTTLLLNQGELLDYVAIRYEYDAEEYVWPNVREVRNEYISVPAEHLAVFRPLLSKFSGICCLGYKLRADGRLALFEINPRIGGDLVFDVPKPRACALFEKLDALLS